MWAVKPRYIDNTHSEFEQTVLFIPFSFCLNAVSLQKRCANIKQTRSYVKDCQGSEAHNLFKDLKGIAGLSHGVGSNQWQNLMRVLMSLGIHLSQFVRLVGFDMLDNYGTELGESITDLLTHWITAGKFAIWISTSNK